MVIDISSKVPDNFDDKSKYEKIQIDDAIFKELNLTPEEELVIKKYLYYAKDASYRNLPKEEVILYFELLPQAIFTNYNKEYALRVLNCLGNDLARKNIKRAWEMVGEFSHHAYIMDSYLIEVMKGR